MAFQCHVCGKEYNNKFNFNYHVAHHFDARPFTCDFVGCPNSYKTKADLRQHQKSHEKAMGLNFFCSECGANFDSSTKLNVHMRESHYSKGTNSWCELCKRNYANYRGHFLVVHEKRRPFSCDLDGKTFAKMHGLARHIEAVHLKMTPFPCTQCKKKFKEASALKKHMKHHIRAVDQCFRNVRGTKANTEDWSEDEEIITEKLTFKCGSCYRGFSSKDSLLKHELRAHLNAKYVCDICGQRYETKTNIIRHIVEKHSLNQPTEQMMTTKLYKCGACKKIISSKNGLERHKRLVHLAIYDFMCEHCSATFRDRGALNKHFEKYHNVKRIKRQDFDCLMCSKSFVSSYSLEKHESSCRLKKQEILNRELDIEADFILVQEISQPTCKLEIDDYKTNGELPFAATIELEEINIKPEPVEYIEQFDDVIATVVSEELIDSDPFNLPFTTLKESQCALELDDEIEVKEETVEADAVVISTIGRIESKSCPKLFFSKLKHFELLHTIKNDFQSGIVKKEALNKSENYMLVNQHLPNAQQTYLKETNDKQLTKLQIEETLLRDKTDLIKKFKCNHCEESFDSRDKLRSHCGAKHAETSDKESFQSRKLSITSSNKKATCRQCLKILSCQKSLKRHIELVHDVNRPTLYCDQCANTFKDFRTLQHHVKKSHTKLNGEGGVKTIIRRRKTTKAIICEDCGDVLYGTVGLLTHRWNKHFNIRIVGKKRFHCLICKQVMNCRVSAMRHHVQVHNRGKVKVRTCRECETDFVLFDDFKKHIELEHENCFICLVCGINCGSHVAFLQHKKLHLSVPEDEKKLICDMCGFKAQQKVTIEAHMVRDHGALKKKYFATCEFCGLTFSCYQSFNTHRKTHRPQTEIKFKCSYCDRAYFNMRELRNHEGSHTNPDEKPYRCEFEGCTREYISYSSFRWHLKYSHKENRNQCKACSEVLTSREKLIAHCEEKHPELRRFICNYCGKSFASQSANIRHMKNCEPTTVD